MINVVNVRVYLATPMTGYDRPTMVARAKEMVAIGAEYGVTVISPVLIENVHGRGKLVQTDELELTRFWRKDKEIIRNRDGNGAHVVLVDKANLKSLGCEREHGFNRYCLFKPTVCLMPSRGPSVAALEDDGIFEREHDAFKFIADNYGTHLRRIKWRISILAKSLPGWIVDQLAAFR